MNRNAWQLNYIAENRKMRPASPHGGRNGAPSPTRCKIASTYSIHIFSVAHLQDEYLHLLPIYIEKDSIITNSQTIICDGMIFQLLDVGEIRKISQILDTLFDLGKTGGWYLPQILRDAFGVKDPKHPIGSRFPRESAPLPV